MQIIDPKDYAAAQRSRPLDSFEQAMADDEDHGPGVKTTLKLLLGVVVVGTLAALVIGECGQALAGWLGRTFN